MKNINICMLEPIAYKEAIALQEHEKQRVLAGTSQGSIFFLEHNPPVITLGKHCSGSDILISEELLNESGYFVEQSSRGGNVTIHERGQLVIYYVLPVKSKRTHEFVHAITDGIVNVLNEHFQLKLFYSDTNPGIWHEDKKCASIGFDLRQGVSMHGVAINVCNSLKGFSYINPCGMPSSSMTTLSLITGRDVTITETVDLIAKLYV